MSKKKLFPAVVVTAFLLILLPVPSQASSRNWTLFPESAAGFFVKIERWWHSILKGPERPEPSPVRQKNGCGIDPNGKPLCPGPGTNQTTGGK